MSLPDKTLTLIEFSVAGGPYDTYARLLALFLPKYIPGHPAILVKSMPGAGGLAAARYLYEAAPRDGTIIGGTPYADIFAQLWNLHQQNKFDEQREMFSKLLLMLNLDERIPGVRPYILKKRGIFKTTVSRQGDHPLAPEAIAEIEYSRFVHHE